MDNTDTVRTALVGLHTYYKTLTDIRNALVVLGNTSTGIVERSRRTWKKEFVLRFEKKLRAKIAPLGLTYYNKPVDNGDVVRCLYRYKEHLIPWTLPNVDYAAHQSTIVTECNTANIEKYTNNAMYVAYIIKNIEPIMAAKYLLAKLVHPDDCTADTNCLRSVYDTITPIYYR